GVASRGPAKLYKRPPRPMPSSAHASTSANVNVEPPKIGAASRYHTSSASKNASPVTNAAINTHRFVDVAGAIGSGSTSGCARDSHHAAPPIATLIAAAIHNVARLPIGSIVTNTGTTAPITAPSVFAPYSAATSLRPASPSVVTARATAGSVPPIASTG